MVIALIQLGSNILANTVPSWATITHTRRDAISFSAQVERAGGLKSRLYQLVARIDSASSISVTEQLKGVLLPRFCPERHINHDGSFCLGLRAGFRIATTDEASAWWDKLRLFLLCQEASLGPRKWPAWAQLSHGEAGEIEVFAESVAARLDKLNEFQTAVRHDSGPLIAALSLLRPETRVLRNGRARCVCGRSDRRGRTKLRRQCRKVGEDCLVTLEYRRREAERAFWKSFAGQPCCGTMDDCPLASYGKV